MFIRSAFSSSTVHDGWSSLSSAIEPDTWGVAIEVPSPYSPSLPVPTAAEKICSPGAVMSGLSARSGRRGPRDEKLAIWSAALTRTMLPLTPGDGSWALSDRPSACEMNTDGVVIVGSVPDIVTKNDSARLSATSVATAPASCAFLTLTVKLHTSLAPLLRSSSAMWPLTAPALVSGRQPLFGIP